MAQTHDHTTQSICPACNFGPFTHNNYFFGKLLGERDFTDETRFHMEKLRHHEQRLHGWGVVCGLKVKPHPNPACRDRFVCIEPGSAVDCCGYDIVVREEECIDITQLSAIKALKEKNDTDGHPLQICLRYRECPTEEIPVLYDDCGCDDTKCAPNRILESYDVDVIVDPKKAPESFGTPKLKWENTVTIAHATRIALHDATPPHRLYVMTADNPAIVYQVSADNHVTITSSAPLAQGVALAVSNDGAHLYVIAESTTASDPRQLHVLDTTKPGLPLIHPPSKADLGDGAAFLAVTADNHLLALGSLSGNVLRWATDIDTPAASPADPQTLSLDANLSGLVLSSDGGKTGYVADQANNRVLTFDTATLTAAAAISAQPTGPLPAGAKPTALAIVRSTGHDLLAVADQINKKMHLLSLTPSALVGSVDLDHAPVALMTSPGGHWVYVLEQDATGSYVQSVSIDGLQLKRPVKPSAAFKVGNLSQQVVLSKSGTHLYIPFTDDVTNPALPLGGVAIVEVSEQACSEILWRHLDGCPHCDIPDCVVLATIENYHVGDKIEAQTDPPADLQNDTTNKIARIDNRTGRRLLPSTQVLTELIQCLLEHGTDGKDGQDGVPGPGLEPGLTRIEALSWTHAARHAGGIPPGSESFFVMVKEPDDPEAEGTPGLVIGFTDKVEVSTTIDAPHIFQVLIEVALPQGTSPDPGPNIICRCPIRGRTVPVDLDLNAQGEIRLNGQRRIASATRSRLGQARGVAFLLEGREVPIHRNIVNGFLDELWVVLRGDFVKDTRGRAIDAEFVCAELPTGDRPRPPADQLGIQGGLFESWFQIQPSQPPP